LLAKNVYIFHFHVLGRSFNFGPIRGGAPSSQAAWE